MAKRIFDVSIHMNEMGDTKAGVPEENYLAIYPTSTHQLAITNSDGDINELYNASNIPVCSDEVAGIAKVDGTTIISTEGVLSAGDGVVINPMTAAGDLIVGGEAGVPGNLAAGAGGQCLMISEGNLPAWEDLPVSSDTVAGIAQVDGTTIISTEGVLSTDESVVINPMTAAGDLIVGGESGVPSRFGIGNANQILATNSAADAPVWIDNLQFANPMTGIGDMIIGGTSGAATKLSAGTDGYLLKMSSGSPAWAPNINYVDFLTTDWVVDGANFSLTIAASALPFGGSRDLLLQVSDASGNLVNINSAINESGDIILTSNSTFDGKLLVSGGASGEISTSGGGVWTKLYTSVPTEADAASVEFVDIFSDDYTKYRVYFDIGCKLGSGQTATTFTALAGPAGATPSYYTSDYNGCLFWNSNMASSSTGVFSSTLRSYNFSAYTNFMFQALTMDHAQGVFRGYMEIERNSGLWNAIIRWSRKTELLTYPAPNHGMCTWYIEQPVSALKFYDSNANNTIMAGAQITVYGIK